MATYGDAILDSIMAQIRGAGGEPPRFGAASKSARLLPWNPSTPMPAGLSPISPAGAVSPAASVPFYNRPIPLPSWLGGAGQLARGALGGPLGWGSAAVATGAPLLKAGAETAAEMYVGPPGLQATVERGRAGFGSVPGAVQIGQDVADAELGVPQDMTSIRTDLNAEDILSRRMLAPRGTGAIQAEGAPARLIDARTSPEFLAAQGPGARPTPPGGEVGAFLGSLIGMKSVVGDAARKAAAAKAAAASLSAQGTYLRGLAAVDAAQRERTQPLYAESVTSMPDPRTGAITVIDKRTGQPTKVIPTQNITMAEAIASAKRNKTYKSDAQVRADILKMPGYKLVD